MQSEISRARVGSRDGQEPVYNSFPEYTRVREAIRKIAVAEKIGEEWMNVKLTACEQSQSPQLSVQEPAWLSTRMSNMPSRA